ncbi:hypothetical protein TNCV_1215341 [Trichonephila clavipes]|nr:hypothetical protein TNCV_1215341 [Trichonephila clavipes]
MATGSSLTQNYSRSQSEVLRDLHTLAVQDCLDREGIQRLVWPARSKDLNPIENVWDALGSHGSYNSCLHDYFNGLAERAIKNIKDGVFLSVFLLSHAFGKCFDNIDGERNALSLAFERTEPFEKKSIVFRGVFGSNNDLY